MRKLCAIVGDEAFAVWRSAGVSRCQWTCRADLRCIADQGGRLYQWQGGALTNSRYYYEAKGKRGDDLADDQSGMVRLMCPTPVSIGQWPCVR